MRQPPLNSLVGRCWSLGNLLDCCLLPKNDVSVREGGELLPRPPPRSQARLKLQPLEPQLMVGTWRRKDTVLVPRHHHSPALPTFRKPHFFANVFRCTTRVTRAHSSGLHQSNPAHLRCASCHISCWLEKLSAGSVSQMFSHR